MHQHDWTQHRCQTSSVCQTAFFLWPPIETIQEPVCSSWASPCLLADNTDWSERWMLSPNLMMKLDLLKGYRRAQLTRSWLVWQGVQPNWKMLWCSEIYGKLMFDIWMQRWASWQNQLSKICNLSWQSWSKLGKFILCRLKGGGHWKVSCARRFLGLVRYYPSFCWNFWTAVTPLTHFSFWLSLGYPWFVLHIL